MCGRFTREKSWREIYEHLTTFLGDHDETQVAPNMAARYNIAPTQNIEVVRLNEKGKWLINPLRWGLLPSWSKDTSWASRMINARAETVEEKRTFAAPFKFRRCLIPADGYYEWRKEEGGKQPYRITFLGEGLMLFAGLWERWKIQSDAQINGTYSTYKIGDIIDSFTILTTNANSQIAEIHNRMPVILSKRDCRKWLDPKTEMVTLRELMFTPVASNQMDFYPVRKKVNSAKYEGRELVQPLV